MPDPRRSLGALGEDHATKHLQRLGMEVLERNFRSQHGELDLVAADPSCLVFCEVKTRLAPGGSGLPVLEGVGPRKRRRVRAMAREWLAARPAGSGRPHRADLRFDAIGVTLDVAGRLVRLEHVENAF